MFMRLVRAKSRVRMRAGSRRGTIRRVNTILRIVLLIWVVGYLFVSCAPILGGHIVIGAIALAGGILLFIPWVVGILILAGMIWLTNEPPRPPQS
jgi:hypothetical protein